MIFYIFVDFSLEGVHFRHDVIKECLVMDLLDEKMFELEELEGDSAMVFRCGKVGVRRG